MNEYQLTVGKLKKQIAALPDDYPVFIKYSTPCYGQQEEASAAGIGQYSSAGFVNPCVIIRPFVNDR